MFKWSDIIDAKFIIKYHAKNMNLLIMNWSCDWRHARFNNFVFYQSCDYFFFKQIFFIWYFFRTTLKIMKNVRKFIDTRKRYFAFAYMMSNIVLFLIPSLYWSIEKIRFAKLKTLICRGWKKIVKENWIWSLKKILTWKSKIEICTRWTRKKT